MFKVRTPISLDKQEILNLYRKVAMLSGGIARSEEEISEDYIEELMQYSALTGLQLVVEHPVTPELIIAEMHGYKLIPKAFSHVLSNLTIAVDPDFQGKGVGKLIFSSFINHISDDRPDILRVELVTHESNAKALRLYKALGFVIEGRLEKRIRFPGKELETDIPMAWFNKNFNGHGQST